MPLCCLRELSILIKVAHNAQMLPAQHSEEADIKLELVSKIRLAEDEGVVDNGEANSTKQLQQKPSSSSPTEVIINKKSKKQQQQHLTLQDRWQKFVDDFESTAAGTREQTMFSTPARLILRRSMLGHRA